MTNKKKSKDIEENWTVVFTTYGDMKAEIIKSKFESMGIPVMLKQEAIGRIIGVTVNGLGKVKILVPESYKTQAKKVLKGK